MNAFPDASSTNPATDPRQFDYNTKKNNEGSLNVMMEINKMFFSAKKELLKFEKAWSTLVFLNDCRKQGLVPKTFWKGPANQCTENQTRLEWETKKFCIGRQYLTIAIKDKINSVPYLLQRFRGAQEDLKATVEPNEVDIWLKKLEATQDKLSHKLELQRDRKIAWLVKKLTKSAIDHNICDKCHPDEYQADPRKDHAKKVHQNTKHLRCENCNCEANQASLKEHVRKVHQKTKGLRCENCNCEANKAPMKKHAKKVHQKIKDLRCENCNCKTNQAPMNEHAKKVHRKTKDLKCENCNYKTNQAPMKEHVEEVHQEANKHTKNGRNRRFQKRAKFRRRKNKELTNETKKAAIHNFSNESINKDVIDLLSKGLKFCPTPKRLNITQLKTDMFHMERKLSWKYHFTTNGNRPIAKEEKTDPFVKMNPFEKERKTNLPPKYPKDIAELVTGVKSNLMGHKNTKIHPNLTKCERKALAHLVHLQKVGRVVLQPTDKGSGWCIMNRKDYIEEGMRHLNEKTKHNHSDHFTEIQQSGIEDVFKKIIEKIDRAEKQKWISTELAEILKPLEAKGGRLYLTPKVHKPKCYYENDSGIWFPPCRTIISSNSSVTERISWFVDVISKNFVFQLPAYLEDSTDLLRYFEQLNTENRVPENAIPVSLDIKNMYGNIPINEGLEALQEKLDSRQNPDIPTQFILELAELVLRNNVFEFDGKFYQQLIGTATGTRMAPTFANIFMGKREKIILDKCPSNLRKFIFCWKRLIDDIFILWTGSYQELEEFYTYLNNDHVSIKYDAPQYDIKENACHFLDLKITVKNRKIETDIYRKPTDHPSALLPSSSHPKHISKNIIYTMAFRLLRICSNQETLKLRLEELKFKYLIPRRYKGKHIDDVFSKILTLNRQTYLQKVNRNKEKTEDILTVPLTYDPRTPHQGKILRTHFNAMITNNITLKKVFTKPPIPALRQTPNLRNLLCKSKLSQIDSRNEHGWKNCFKAGISKRPCKVCAFSFENTKEIIGNVNNYKHKIQGNLNCKTRRGIYYWKCTYSECQDKPCVEYVGMTKRSFLERYYNHISYIRQKKLNEPAGKHFNLKGHGLQHMKGLLIENVRSNDPLILKIREEFYIDRFDTFQNGLNRE